VHCFVRPVYQEIPWWLVTTERLRKEARIRAFVVNVAGFYRNEVLKLEKAHGWRVFSGV
jgi:hypothetical protein